MAAGEVVFPCPDIPMAADSNSHSTPNERVLEQYRHSAGACVCGNLRMAARAVTAVYDDALRPLGIDANQLNCLWVLLMAQPVSMGELARLMVADQSTLSRNVAVLERRGWVVRKAGRDRRTRLIRLAARGRRILVRAWPLWESAQTLAHSKLDATLLRALQRSRRTLQTLSGQ
jgi:DNA-binding MarR family transcriptional regulator